MPRRWDRIQHAIIESFTSRGTRPKAIWNLYELEPDHEQRAYLKRKIARLGAGEHDFLRWRNACVAYSLSGALEALNTANQSHETPMATPLWVTTHLLRRKAHSANQASIAIHLALVAVPSYGPLVPAYEQHLLLAFEAATRYNLIHTLPALVSRILALPMKHHAKILVALSKHELPSSPLAAVSLQLVLNDINARSTLLSRETWQSVWDKWVVLHPLGDDFTASLRLQMKDQGFRAPHYRNIKRSEAYTQTATYFPDRTTPSRKDPTLAALTAAAYSKQVSARLLLGIASTLADGLFPRYPNKKRRHSPIPSVTFLTALILGLTRKGAYSRAIGVWQNAEKQKIAVTPKLLEAVLSAYILDGNFEETVRLLDLYANPWPKLGPNTTSQKGGFQLPSNIVTLLVSQLPASGKHIAFRQAFKRWGIQPDSAALEAVMVGAAQAIANESQDDLDIRSNIRELKEGFKDLFRSKPVQIEPLEENLLSPGLFDKRHAIRLFRNVLLRNWPFIQGARDGYWAGPLGKKMIELFVPTPLTVRRRLADSCPDEDMESHSAFEFNPSPLHPSPTPSYPHACPTRKAWTAYLSLLEPYELPIALGWMRSIDEFLHTPPARAGSPLDLFQPERAAMIDVLIRWEDTALAGETPIGRAWEEMKEGVMEGVGKEGALRSWLIGWLGDEGVPSRNDVAKARIRMKE
ncbi:unnamed protein product [Rhizoctonia solani]|uniref:Uncharacterized protein n=1 Tax=Rhizoctonia solani TaxID=456999 RepID=A0A8H2XWX5_9AGAM|nr:unnamed protein product [Rhizoctonia solani]